MASVVTGRGGQPTVVAAYDQQKVAQDLLLVLCETGKATLGDPPKENVKSQPEKTNAQSPYHVLVTKAKRDLADRMNIAGDRIKLLEVKEVVWPDASLGCPQPGMKYKQIPSDGLLIRLGVKRRVYRYHSGANREPFLCEQTFKAPKSKPLELDQFLPKPAKEDD